MGIELLNSRESAGASSFGYAIPVHTSITDVGATKSMSTQSAAPYAAATTIRIVQPSEATLSSVFNSSQPSEYSDKVTERFEYVADGEFGVLDGRNETRDYEVTTFVRQPKS